MPIDTKGLDVEADGTIPFSEFWKQFLDAARNGAGKICVQPSIFRPEDLVVTLALPERRFILETVSDWFRNPGDAAKCLTCGTDVTPTPVGPDAPMAFIVLSPGGTGVADTSMAFASPVCKHCANKTDEQLHDAVGEWLSQGTGHEKYNTAEEARAAGNKFKPPAIKV